MGRAFALYAILGHEAAHRLLFSNRRANDLIGRWGLSYPAFVPFDLYRRSHFAHHKDEMGPNEPDLNLYLGYPITRASMRRKLRRDAVGNSGWKNLKGLARRLPQPGRPAGGAAHPGRPGGRGRPPHRRDRSVVGLPGAVAGPLDDRVARASTGCARSPSTAGMARSRDRRETTHVVRQTWLARFWIVPFNTGWHLAHHVDMGVPFHNLPRLHDELVDSGWVTPELTYPSYLALWKDLASG